MKKFSHKQLLQVLIMPILLPSVLLFSFENVLANEAISSSEVVSENGIEGITISSDKPEEFDNIASAEESMCAEQQKEVSENEISENDMPDALINSENIETAGASFSERDAPPEAGNAYYYSSKNAYFPEFAPTPGSISKEEAYGNCTWYAWGRAYELLQSRPNLKCGNAKDWYEYNKNGHYYDYNDTIPKVGAVACWAGNGYGHVAFVERVNNNGTIDITDSSYRYYDRYGNFKLGWLWNRSTVATNNMSAYIGTTFQGYIYLPVGDSSEEGREMTEADAGGKSIPEGDYQMVSALESDYTLNVPGEPDTMGNSVAPQMMHGLNRKNDVFTLKYLNNGFYKIIHRPSGKALDNDGEKVHFYINNDQNSSQQWSIKLLSDGNYRIQSKRDGYSFEVYGGNKDNGTGIRQYEWNETAAQRWSFIGAEMDKGAEYTVYNGDYQIVSALGSDYTLDVPGDTGDIGETANAQMKHGLGRKNDVFTLKYQDNGFYKIIHTASGRALDVDYASVYSGENVKFYLDNNNTTAQEFSIKHVGEGWFRIQPRCSGYSLDVCSGSTDDGANVWQYEANDSPSQKWKFIGGPMKNGSGKTIAEGDYRIVNALDESKGLDVPGNETTAMNGDNAQIADNLTDSKDIFTVKYIDDGGFYTITQKGTDMSLDVENESFSEGANVQWIKYKALECQQFSIKSEGNGWYQIRNRNSGYALDVANSNVQQWYENHTDAQKWKFIPVAGTISVNGISFDEKNINVGVRENKTISYTFSPENATNQEVTLSSNDVSIATVDSDGKITGVSEGSTYITVRTAEGDFYDTCNVTVVNGAFREITIRFNANGGKSDVTEKKVIIGKTFGELPVPKRDDYKFLGWYTGITTGTVITETSEVSFDVDTTLYARWEKNETPPDPTPIPTPTPTPEPKAEEGKCLVIFISEGKEVSRENVIYGHTISKVPTVTGDGTFVGWVNGKSIWNFTTPVTYDLTLEAKFVKDTISENKPSGSGMDSRPAVTEDKKIYLVVGQTYTLGKKGFTSNNTKTATVDKNKGKITAKTAGKGDAVISDGSESYTVIVQRPLFSAEYKKKDLIVGRSVSLKLSGIDSSYSAYYPISWQSSNEKLATVNDGVVTGMAKGKVNINAYVGGKKYTSTVNVKDTYTMPKKIPADGTIEINPLHTVQLKYDSNVFVPQNATWTGLSSNSLEEIKNNKGNVTGYKNNVVEIYKTGKAKAIGAGTTTLTGTDRNNRTVNLKIIVNPVSTKRAVYLNVAKTETIKFPKVNNSKAKWLLDDKEEIKNSVIEINNKGKVKGLSAGITKIGCTYAGFTFETYVYVENPEIITDQKLVKNGNNYELKLPQNSVYAVKLKDIHQTPVWSSKKKDIAFVDENGTVYARNAGSTVLSTKLNGKTYKINVKVE